MYFVFSNMKNLLSLTMAYAMKAVVCKVHSQKCQIPCPWRVPGQFKESVVIPYVYVTN